jgi:hypothetical protein
MFDKSEIRKALFHEAGCDADDWLEGARQNRWGFEGAKQALAQAAKDVQGLVQTVKEDLDNGKLEGKEAPEVAEYAILQITRAVDSLVNSTRHFDNCQKAAQGEMSAYEAVVKHFKKKFDQAETHMQNIRDAIASGEILVEDDGEMVHKGNGRSRASGVRPGGGIAAQRRAEDAADAGEPEERSQEEGAPAKAEAAPVKPKRKRKTRKKKTKAPEVESPGATDA